MNKAIDLIMKEISEHFGIKQSRLVSLRENINNILFETSPYKVVKKVKVIQEVLPSDYIPPKIDLRNVSHSVKALVRYEIEQERESRKRARRKPMNGNTFCKSQKWREMRYNALVKYGAKCALCGATASDDVLCVDHIKPKSKYPELAYDINNLQVLCATCNNGKLDKHEHDFR